MSDRVSKKVCLDGNLFIEVYIDKRSYFVIVYTNQLIIPSLLVRVQPLPGLDKNDKKSIFVWAHLD
jgi:hypothetical protein